MRFLGLGHRTAVWPPAPAGLLRGKHGSAAQQPDPVPGPNSTRSCSDACDPLASPTSRCCCYSRLTGEDAGAGGSGGLCPRPVHGSGGPGSSPEPGSKAPLPDRVSTPSPSPGLTPQGTLPPSPGGGGPPLCPRARETPPTVSLPHGYLRSHTGSPAAGEGASSFPRRNGRSRSVSKTVV